MDRNVFKNLFPALDDSTIDQIVTAQMRDGSTLTLNDTDVLMTIHKMLQLHDVKMLISYINDSENLVDFIFNGITPNITEARTSNHRQLSLENARPVAVEIGVVCRRCGHKRFYHASKQTASGDEATTNIYKCENCGLTFRAR